MTENSQAAALTAAHDPNPRSANKPILETVKEFFDSISELPEIHPLSRNRNQDGDNHGQGDKDR